MKYPKTSISGVYISNSEVPCSKATHCPSISLYISPIKPLIQMTKFLFSTTKKVRKEGGNNFHFPNKKKPLIFPLHTNGSFS